MPVGLVPANATATAPGTKFATPVPTTAMIHGNISSGCSSCHDTGHLWMDVSRYPISPTAVSGVSTTQYVGFQTRPVTAASTYSVADAAHPTSGDCSQCHSGTNYFSAQAEPPNHIPTLAGAQCVTCHTTAGNFAVYTSNLTQLHTAVATTCSTCHADGKGPFAGATGFAIVQMSTRGVHIPITNKGLAVECSGCHKTVTAFSGTMMSHAAIGDTATAASGNACDACHESGYRSKFYGVSIGFTRDSPNHYICGAPGTPSAPNVTVCPNGGSDCLTGCHHHQNQIPSQYARVKPGTPSKQIQGATPPTPPTAAKPPAGGWLRQAIIGRTATNRLAETFGGKVDHAALGGVACQTCHNGSAATGKAPAHPLTNNACRDCHSTMAWSPVLHVDHADVIGTCATCHDGRHATGKPATHPMAGVDCDRCHTTSAWKPAAFDHKSVAPGSCATCHNGLQAPGKPATHVVTMLSCDSCHYVLGWKPVKPAAQPPTPTRKPTPRQVTPSRGRDTAPLAPPL
jgi:Cytochrome c7 and related cytochrome c